MGTPIAPDDVTCAGRGAYGRDRGSAPGGAAEPTGCTGLGGQREDGAAAAVGRVPPEARRWTGTGRRRRSPAELTARGEPTRAGRLGAQRGAGRRTFRR